MTRVAADKPPGPSQSAAALPIDVPQRCPKYLNRRLRRLTLRLDAYRAVSVTGWSSPAMGLRAQSRAKSATASQPGSPQVKWSRPGNTLCAAIAVECLAFFL